MTALCTRQDASVRQRSRPVSVNELAEGVFYLAKFLLCLLEPRLQFHVLQLDSSHSRLQFHIFSYDVAYQSL